MGIDPQLLSNREKTMLIDALKQTYALPELLAALGLARSPTSITVHVCSLLTGMPTRVASSRTSSNSITVATDNVTNIIFMKSQMGLYFVLADRSQKGVPLQASLIATSYQPQRRCSPDEAIRNVTRWMLSRCHQL
jgi:hypothetical protein